MIDLFDAAELIYKINNGSKSKLSVLLPVDASQLSATGICPT
jgi:hypothetical protein